MISKEKLKVLEKELDSFDLDKESVRQALDLAASSSINSKVESLCSTLTMFLMLIATVVYGGIVGKLALATFILSKIAMALTLLDNYRAEKRLQKEFVRFTSHLKDKGINLDE